MYKRQRVASLARRVEGRPPMSEAATATASGLSGAEKAAILLLKLGSEHSAEVLKLLGENEVTQITAELVKSRAVCKEDAAGPSTTPEVPTNGLGEDSGGGGSIKKKNNNTPHPPPHVGNTLTMSPLW